eukprot:CAMPEP_0198272272 /NCGR_PEP_ID=MMETSP1447-20131203/52539_1 /TAXON_ID=420782 /ORGANISM="Chaetoceros dichaeta, Strain CCMP1751" /LENGTH=71 /DNA_ID=CAMNT_0043965357 /DNA_START=23 /DNA_END=235 /DNA_ORIENTATION=+
MTDIARAGELIRSPAPPQTALGVAPMFGVKCKDPFQLQIQLMSIDNWKQSKSRRRMMEILEDEGLCSTSER